SEMCIRDRITTHLLGSNASSVIRHTHIPVLVVR
ncbi:hypothetical protein F8O53_08695, partial [Enterobacter sp. 63]